MKINWEKFGGGSQGNGRCGNENATLQRGLAREKTGDALSHVKGSKKRPRHARPKEGLSMRENDLRSTKRERGKSKKREREDGSWAPLLHWGGGIGGTSLLKSAEFRTVIRTNNAWGKRKGTVFSTTKGTNCIKLTNADKQTSAPTEPNFDRTKTLVRILRNKAIYDFTFLTLR